ncbi:hypothetical protein G6F35_013002 [Rhizopus arrhizus]|nr:hypothetical protein G6F35_013002 [Rhizopus arrhizus]
MAASRNWNSTAWATGSHAWRGSTVDGQRSAWPSSSTYGCTLRLARGCAPRAQAEHGQAEEEHVQRRSHVQRLEQVGAHIDHVHCDPHPPARHVAARLPPLADQAQRGQHRVQPRQCGIGEGVHGRAQRHAAAQPDGQVAQQLAARQRHDADAALVGRVLAPVEPAVDQEAAEGDLQQGVRVQLGLGEHQPVQRHRQQAHRPCRQPAPGHQPDAEDAAQRGSPLEHGAAHSANVTDRRACRGAPGNR